MFQQDPERVVALAAAGVLTSITAASLTGRFGRRARRCAFDLMELGVAHDIASDAHDLATRLPGLAGDLHEAAAIVEGLGESIAWLTAEAPAAILAGRAPHAAPARIVPPPPSSARRRNPLARLLRRD
jgi:protein-tyrosine phosphatase